MMKRLISISLVMSIMLMLFAFTPIVNAADYEYSEGDWNFSYSDTKNMAYVKGYTGTETSVTIPSSIDVQGEVYPVTAVGASAFQNNTTITSVTIPKSITELRNYAFDGCTSLSEVIFEEGSALTTLGTDSNGGYVFQGCTSLESIVLPDSVEKIYKNIFGECTNLKTVVIPDSVTVVGTYLFKNCSSLENVTMGSGIKTLSKFMFQNCTGLKEITIPANVTSMSVASTSLSFAGCTSLATVKFEGMTCPTLSTSVSSSTKVSSRAFGYATKVYYPADGTGYDTTGAVWPYNFANGAEFIAYTSGDTPEPTATPEPTTEPTSEPDPTAEPTAEPTATPEPTTAPVDDTWTVTADGVITAYNGGAAENLTIPSVVNGINVTKIGTKELCSSATAKTITGTLTVPEGVTEIGANAFSYFAVTTFDLPTTLETIGGTAFRYCGSLKEITIPANVKTIGGRAFRSVYLTKVTFEGAAAPELTNTVAGGANISPFEGATTCTVYYPANGTGYDEAWKASFLGRNSAETVTFVPVGEPLPTAEPSVDEVTLAEDNLTTSVTAEKSFTAFAKLANIVSADASEFGIKFVSGSEAVTEAMTKSGEAYAAEGALANGAFSVKLVNGEGEEDYLDAEHMGFIPYVIVGDDVFYGTFVEIK